MADGYYGRMDRSCEQIAAGGSEASPCRNHCDNGAAAPEALRPVSVGKETFMPLLLEADPSEDMIRQYLDQGELYAMMVDKEPVAVAVVLPLGGGAFELKNLAVAESSRRMGYGSRMLSRLMAQYAARGTRMVVGTSPANIPFYERLGFKIEGVIPHFFRDNYSEPIIEDGVLLDDMTLLAAKI